MQKKYLYIVICTILLVGCSPYGKSGKNLYTSFFAEKGVMYFIKPFELEGINEKSNLDFTFTSRETLEGITRVNISFHTAKPIHKITDIMLVSKGKTFRFNNPTFMFIEKRKKHFESRFGFDIETQQLKEIFDSNLWELKITEENNQTHVFSPSSSTAKKITLLKNNLFVIFK